MRREVEIKKIASAFAIDEVKDTCNPASKRGLLYAGFVSGAEWADAHPHWISIDDELPKINPNGSEWDYSDDVLVYLKDGSITVGRWERDNSTGEQYWLLDIEKDLIVTHWMPLPSTEHIADANKKVDRVIGTADHIKTALDVLNKKGGEE